MKLYCKNFKDSLGILIVLSCLTGCGDTPQDTSQATPPVRPPIHQEVEVLSPKAPQPKKAQVSESTRQTYQFYCAQCHGTKGKGDGLNAKFLTVPPRNHTKAEYLETRTDAQLFEAIKLGGLFVGRAPCMPAWGHTLDEETMHSLVQYIRELCQCEAL